MGRGISPRAWLLTAALLAVAAVTVGLTRPPDANQSREVRRVVKTYEVALMKGDGATACAQLTAAAKRDLLAESAAAGLGDDCAEVAQSMRRYVDSLVAQAPSAERAAAARRMIDDPVVDVVSVRGERATARISGTSGYPIPLERGDGGWKISRLPYPGSETK